MNKGLLIRFNLLLLWGLGLSLACGPCPAFDDLERVLPQVQAVVKGSMLQHSKQFQAVGQNYLPFEVDSVLWGPDSIPKKIFLMHLQGMCLNGYERVEGEQIILLGTCRDRFCNPPLRCGVKQFKKRHDQLISQTDTLTLDSLNILLRLRSCCPSSSFQNSSE